MAKKTVKGAAPKKSSARANRLLDNQLANAVRESAQQIWLAGMGAFSKAQAEGSKVFDTLVKEGLHLQHKTQAAAEEKINEVTGRMSAMAGTVTARAGHNWDKLESIFEARTAKAMNKLGVPTATDLHALARRVDALADAVAQLSGKLPARGAAKGVAKGAATEPPKRTVVRKAPTKRAPRPSA